MELSSMHRVISVSLIDIVVEVKVADEQTIAPANLLTAKFLPSTTTDTDIVGKFLSPLELDCNGQLYAGYTYKLDPAHLFAKIGCC